MHHSTSLIWQSCSDRSSRRRFSATSGKSSPWPFWANDPAYYQGLFSRLDLDNVIAFTRPRFIDPDYLRPRNFVQGWLPDDEPFAGYYPDLPAVHRAFAHGKTLIIKSCSIAGRLWRPCAATLKRSLAAPSTRIYISRRPEHRVSPPITTRMKSSSCKSTATSTGGCTAPLSELPWRTRKPRSRRSSSARRRTRRSSSPATSCTFRAATSMKRSPRIALRFT